MALRQADHNAQGLELLAESDIVSSITRFKLMRGLHGAQRDWRDDCLHRTNLPLSWLIGPSPGVARGHLAAMNRRGRSHSCENIRGNSTQKRIREQFSQNFHSV